MKMILIIAMILGIGAGQASASDHLAQGFANIGQTVSENAILADGDNNYPVKPSDAALIAQRTVPDSKVLNVKLLPSGEYVVTLKAGGSVQKVTVNATSGAVS